MNALCKVETLLVPYFVTAHVLEAHKNPNSTFLLAVTQNHFPQYNHAIRRELVQRTTYQLL